MAAVWRAQDLQLDRAVAVKVFSAGEASDTARREAEAQTLARLNHPNLVTLLDAHLATAGTDEPSYIVMELVEGPSLRQELDRGPLPAEEVAVLAAELAEALVAVHAAGIVHRDLKPANILLTLTGLPSQPYRGKLADFGIAHLVGSDRITTDGIVVGTAAYLSPEQARGAEPGPASDIYALGLIVLECLTGEPPFTGTAAESVGARLVRDPEIPTGLPIAWTQLLREMTARDAAARPDAIAVAVRARETAQDLVGWSPATAAAQAAATAQASATVRIDQAPSDAPTVPMVANATDSGPGRVPAPVSDVAPGAPGRARRRIVAIGSAAAAVLVAVVVAVAVTTSGGGKQIVQTPDPSDSATVAPVSSTEPTSGPTPAPSPSSVPEPSATEQPAAPSPATSDGNNGNNGNNGNGNGKGKPKKNK
jgi:serine/threonine protein kinase